MKGTVPALLLPALLTACSGTPSPTAQADGWSDIPNAHARFFQLAGSGAARRAIVFGPGGRGDTLAVYRWGGGREGSLGDGIMLPPLERVAVASTTHLPYFRALGRAAAVVGIAHLGHVRDSLFRAAIGKGRVAEIATATGIDKERLIALAPCALFDHPFGKQAATAESAPGVPTVLVTEYLEEHPLGRAEWLRFFGALLGEEGLADSLFAGIRERYLAAMAAAGGARPLVFFGSAWQGQWFVPPADSHMAVLISDAGGRYGITWSGGGGNIPLDIEVVIDQARRADRFGALLSAEGPVTAAILAHGDKRLMDLPALREGGFHANGATSDFFGEALLEPDVLLRDLRCVFHPSRCGGHRAKYFFPVAR